MTRTAYLVFISTLLSLTTSPAMEADNRKPYPLPAKTIIATPYPEALATAAVTVSNLSDLSKSGLVIGNGEVNAIVYSMGPNLLLRIGKNDCWDLRVDTESDPPMPTINPATGVLTNGHGPVGSWKNHAYPTSLPCAEVVLHAQDHGEITRGTLNLANGVATVTTVGAPIDIRVLAQGNVLLINSDRTLSLTGITDFMKDKDLNTWVSKADIGTQDDYLSLHQNIPGDKDMNGMDIYVVAGKKGATQAIAVVTSRDVPHPYEEAVALVTKTLSDANAIAVHEACWQAFWATSGIQIGDAELQNWWYRMLYFFRTFSRSNGNAIGLAACFDHLAGWHNSLKINYNIQQTYLAAGPTGHPDLIEPLIDHFIRGLPRGKWFAKASFIGSEGAFFFSDTYPFEPDPAQCQTNNKHQQTYMPYGYTWGMAGHVVTVIWEYYAFAPSAERLDRIYSLLREIGLFYCSVLEKCTLVNGKRKMGPSYFPEIGGFNQFNVCYDIHFITSALRIAREAATIKGELDFVKRLGTNLDQLPTYGTQADPSQGGLSIIEPWLGGQCGKSDRHGTLIQGIFPASIINWFSSDEDKEMAKRTINYVERKTTHANSNVTINVARARLGLGADAIANAKLCFSGSPGKHFSREQPNGLFYWNAHGYYMTEQVAIARLVTELLLQSVGGVIRIFPAWPTAMEAHFTDLLAHGGFAVSADNVEGIVTRVRIRSQAGGTVRFLNPWKTRECTVMEEGAANTIKVTTTEGISSFPTTIGTSYLLVPSR